MSCYKRRGAICERRSRAMTTPPSKTPDLQTTLNRLRKNYAQNPLYVWLFSASCTTHQLLTNLSSGSHPESISRIPWCSGIVEYSSLRGTYRIRRVHLSPPHFININMELWNHSRRLIEWRGYHSILVTSLFPHQLPPQSASSRYPPSLIPRRQPRGLQRTHIWIILLSRRRHCATNRHIMYITYYPHSPLFPQMQLCKKKDRTNQLQWAAAAGGG